MKQKMKKTINKAILNLMLLFAISVLKLSAQNRVVNGGFETTTNLCPGPVWLGTLSSVVPNWSGLNIAWPSFTYNTGAVIQSSSPCYQSGFGPAGLAPFEGTKSIVLALAHYNHSIEFQGSRAISPLLGALEEGCYDVGIALAGNNSAGWTQVNDNVFEVVIKNSSSLVAEMVVGTFTQNPSSGWVKYNSKFTIPSLLAGIYDVIELRHKEDPASSYDEHGIIVDDVSISKCAAEGGCNSNFDFTLKSSTLGIGGIGDITLKEYHTGSTYEYDYGDSIIRSFPISKNYAPGTYHICVTEYTLALDGKCCKTCLDICVGGVGSSWLCTGPPPIIGSITNLELFPNPASESVNAKFKMIDKGNINIKIMDANGNTIISIPEMEYNSGEQSIEINTKILLSGVYNVVLTKGDQTATEKLVISK